MIYLERNKTMPIKHEAKEKKKNRLFQKKWFMWLGLIIFPPLGIYLLWKKHDFSTRKRNVLTLIAIVYFLFLIIFTMIRTVPLFYSHDEFLKEFNNEVEALNLSYSLSDTEIETSSITSKLEKDIVLIESIDEKDNIHELIMIGQGEGKDIVLLMGVLIGMTNPTLSQEDVGEVLSDLHLFDENYDFQNNEVTIERNSIRYHLKYDQSVGVIFSVSKVN